MPRSVHLFSFLGLTLALAACGQSPASTPAQTAAGQRPGPLALTAGGVYELHNACSDRVLDVENASPDNGARVQIWDDANIPNQRWKLEQQGDGTYVLIAQHSGKALDALGWGNQDGSWAGQWEVNRGGNQRWAVTDLGNGFSKVRAAYTTDKVLDVSGAGTTNGTPVQLWTDNGTCAQQWKFMPVGTGTAPTTPTTPAPAPTGPVLTVGPGKQFSTLTAAVDAAQPGSTIRVDAGTYTNDFPGAIRDLTVEGVGGLARFVATATVPNDKGILVVSGAVTLRRLELSGARGPSQNNAGVRYEGGDLVIEDSYLHHNQNGILATPATPGTGTVTVRRSEFAFNGEPNSGYGTHNLYINNVDRFTFDSSYTHEAVGGGAAGGHELKTRARNSVITNSRIYDLGGHASYSIDVPNAGNAQISGNVIEQGPASDNPYVITYGTEGASNPGRNLTVTDNTVVNRRAGGAGLLNRTPDAQLTVTGNTVFGLSLAGFLQGNTGTVSGNTVTSAEPALDTSHPFTP